MYLKSFGIEVRKIGNTHNLYKDVDLILSNNGIPARGVSGNLQAQAVGHALQQMLKADRHFSVCTITNCIDVCQVVVPSERMAIYRSIHCINWSDMQPDFRQMVIAMILDDFREVLNPAA